MLKAIEMSHVLTVTEAVRNFSDYISRVAYRHESFILKKGTKAVAELRPVPSGRRLGDLPGILRSVPHLASGDADSFMAEIDKIRTSSNREGIKDPWAS